MKTTLRLLPALVLAGASFAQTSYQFRTVLHPGMSIGGHAFARDTKIEAVVTNDAGEIAFIAHWPVAGERYEPASVFTLHRLVASGEGIIDGKVLLSIGNDARIAISNSGVVAYEAFYDDGNAPGIFVEEHYALTPAELPDLKTSDFTVTDAGKVATADEPLPVISINSRGEMAIPINTREGPFIIIATPVKK